jgi:hypothetical protein
VGRAARAGMADDLISLFSKITTNDHDALVAQFSRVLQVDTSVATFFLEASSWNVEMAVHNYLASTQGYAEGPRAGHSMVTPLTEPPQAAFAGDLAPWQTRAFLGGTRLPIRLRFQNTGREAWPHDTFVVHVDGDRLGGVSEIAVGPLAPQQQVEVLLVLLVPQAEGTHIGSWRLACRAGYFGEPVYMIVNSSPAAAPVSFDAQDFMDSRQLVQHQQQAEQQLDLLTNMAGKWGVGEQQYMQQQQQQQQQQYMLQQQEYMQQQQQQQLQHQNAQQQGFQPALFGQAPPPPAPRDDSMSGD